MVYSKIKKILFILLCCFILLFPFWCVRGLCAEEEEILTPTVINGMSIASNRNYFDTASGSIAYVELEKGYKYIFLNTTTEYRRNLAVSSDIPVVNGIYKFLVSLEPGQSYEYIPNDDTYLYFEWSASSGQISRIKLTSMDGAVSDLVNNVGIQSLWNTFNDANPFLLVVVLFSFGLFIIIALVRKLRKGKGGF